VGHAGRGRDNQLALAAGHDTAADHETAAGPAAAAGSGLAADRDAVADHDAAASPGLRARVVRSRAVRHLGLLACYLAAGIAATWPRAAYLTGKVPAVRDISSYVWDLWWVARQVAHLGNPWFTHQMAAPAGMQLGFDTIMPLAGLMMTPVTLASGPVASFFVLTIAMPGLLCYVMYRAALLWLRQPGAIAAGALFGLSSTLAWQDWYHLNIAAGALFLPMTVEAAVRLRRSPGRRQGIILGLVLGASVLVNQETAVMAVILAALMLGPWLACHPAAARAGPVSAGAMVAVVVASPQLIAMAQQAAAGGNTARASTLARGYGLYGAQLPGLFGPSPRIADFGLSSLAAVYQYRQPAEGVPTFGLVLTILAVAGLVVSWRRRSAWLLALLWFGCAALALGTTLYTGSRPYVPLAGEWHGARVSLLLPYTWFVRIPGMSALREADRLALLGLVPAVLLAGSTVDWLRDHAKPLAVTVLALAVLEAGWSGNPHGGTMRTALPALDRPVAADRSDSIVLDIPFGLRGGIPLYGSPISPRPLLLATADGHPRAISYSSWVPAPAAAAIVRHAFYGRLIAAQHGRRSSSAQQAAARQDARSLDIGWVLAWRRLRPAVSRYLAATGFRFSYRADGVSVYRPAWRSVAHATARRTPTQPGRHHRRQ
jgi:hypothetical protein